MADLAVPYTLATPAGTVTFNDGSVDQTYITSIIGLEGAPVRAPVDDMPYGHGGLWHNFWEGPRHIIVDGLFLIQSVRNCDAEMALRNQMEDDLRVALRSIASVVADTGTLTWTPRGMSTRVLTVRHDVQLDCPEDQNYMVRTFHFGLVAADPDWDGWTS